MQRNDGPAIGLASLLFQNSRFYNNLDDLVIEANNQELTNQINFLKLLDLGVRYLVIQALIMAMLLGWLLPRMICVGSIMLAIPTGLLLLFMRSALPARAAKLAKKNKAAGRMRRAVA